MGKPGLDADMQKQKTFMIYVTKTTLPDFDNYCSKLKELWKNSWITNNGQFVQLLEKRLQNYLGVKNLLVVTNGTLALQLILKSLDLQGEVITTPFTFAATTNSILWEGLTPIFADIDPNTFNIDPDKVEEKITNKTCAILAVHVFGNACNFEKLGEIAKKHKIKLIYDAAHSFGCEYKGKSLASYGDCSMLSFHATKVFNTIEGGAIIVKNNAVFEKMKLMRNFGIVEHQEKVTCLGINAKMNEFQAIMGLCNFDNVNKNIFSRKKIYEHYKKALSDIKSVKFQEIINSKYNYSYMPVLFNNMGLRNKIFLNLIKNGVTPRKYFKLITELDFLKKKLNYCKNDLKNSYYIANRILCLPIYPDLDLEDVDKIANIIKNTCE